MNSITSLRQMAEIPADERKYWYIPASLSTTVPVRENNEPLVDIRERFKHEGLHAVYAPVNTEFGTRMYARVSVVDRLVASAQLIHLSQRPTVVLKFTDTFRPLALQRRYFDQIRGEIAKKEGLSGRPLWDRVTQFIADPEICPPHTTGGAVDCTLCDSATGEELDMGTPVDSIDNRANTWHELVQGAPRYNREFLFFIMTSVGFVNLASEWWHYSYGDQYWAAYTGNQHALYRPLESA